MRDHTRNVFEKSAMKLVSQSISNRHIHVSNEYVETIEGQQTSVFRDGSNMYLTEEQYVMVKHVGLNFISCVRYF
jgi:propanediol utilization protein